MKRATAPAAALDAATIAHLADRVLAQDVVTVSIEELCAVLSELKQQGYVLKPRTEWEKHDAPNLLIVVREANISAGRGADEI